MDRSERSGADPEDAPATRVERPRTGELAAKPRPAPPPAATPPHPTSLGIEVTELLATGGMGVVYRAHQTSLGRPIAFKRLLDAPSEEMRARFVREARLTAQLDHPNIVPVHLLEPGSDVVPSGYAMKLVEGKTLEDLLDETRARTEKSQPLDADHALETRLEHFLKVCDALAFAHDRGIIHRDLKPSNIMIGEFGAVYVMDWGIARPIGGAEPISSEPTTKSPSDAALTRVGVRVGTPKYMSPEQAQGKNEHLDARSDQYALGLLLHELVSLASAITSDSELGALEEAELGRKAPLDTVDGKTRRVPNELRAIVARATAVSPEGRYGSVRALADDVRRFLRGEAVHALPEGVLGRLLRFMSRHRRATLTAFLGVIAAAALALSWTRYRHAADQLAVQARGAQVTALYGDVARQGHHIDAELLKLEEALEGLATAAEWALTGPEPAPEAAPIFFDVDFANPARRPPDFTDKTAYRWPVSVDHPVVGVAPGADRAALLPKIRRVAPLREHMRNMVVAAAVGDTAKLAPDDARTLLLTRKSPIDYAYIDLPEGIHVVWPGVDALPAGYDVRTASFYKLSDHQHGKRWGAPYVDATTDAAGDDLVLPCTEGLWSPTGEFLGVAGVEITVTKMVETSLVLPQRTALRASLVDAKGRKIIDSRDAGKRFVTNGTDEAAEFTDFDVPEIVAAIRAGDEGLREVVRDGRPVVIAFVRLDALDWYYVVEVDGGTLGAP